MSKPLSREQVERLCERIHKEITWKHEINYILDTDAALRAENERLKAEAGYYDAKDAMKVLTETNAALQAENKRLLENLSLCKGNELANQVDDLTAQLAAMDPMCQHKQVGCLYRQLTEQRDIAIRQCNRVEQQLATMTKDRDDWVTEAEQFSAKHAASEAKVLALEATLESKAH